ncbi:hypothetical protein OOK44_36195 [Streptomyces cellulosae]|uniref:Uncharacterized protein n=1 Tax=Streptomyces althioticus TaxID=83380 RepID=A0ABZ1YJ19_9ACTN|nr:hypothetical protein [Streptomyces cellulosae]WTB93445.1 hypothetical protein OIE99_34945 [Streptomyces cellulosae]WTC60836.1 hypothetical protein OH715_36695 [Streptomyces cellulosae]
MPGCPSPAGAPVQGLTSEVSLRAYRSAQRRVLNLGTDPVLRQM